MKQLEQNKDYNDYLLKKVENKVRHKRAKSSHGFNSHAANTSKYTRLNDDSSLYHTITAYDESRETLGKDEVTNADPGTHLRGKFGLKTNSYR